jgi:recombination protein RecT
MIGADMNTTAATRVSNAPSKLDQYRIEVLPPERARDLYNSLPSHIKPAVFERNLVNALMANPSLMDYDPRLIFREVSKAAGLGLLLDPLLGEGYIVTAYNYKTRKTEPQLRVGYKGMNKLARQTGNVSGIYAHEVHALDEIECDLGFPKVFHHKPKLFVDRGPIVGYVALVAYKDATFDFEPMSLEQCLAIRDRSDAWKAYKADKIKSTPWASDESEMCKKTVLRRLMKRQDQSPELVRAFQIEDEAEQIDAHTITPEIPYARVPSPSEMIEGPKDETPAQTEGNMVNAAASAKADPITSGPQTVVTRPEGCPDAKKFPDDFLKWAEARLAKINDADELQLIFEQIVEPSAEGIMQPDYLELQAIMERHEKRLGSN